jgi:hypothetical protein
MSAPAFNRDRTNLGETAIPQWEPDRARYRVALHASREGWDAASSLALVEAICAPGGGLHRAVRATGRSRNDCLAQWFRLMPETYRGGIDNQKLLLAMLREAVANDAALPPRHPATTIGE